MKKINLVILGILMLFEINAYGNPVVALYSISEIYFDDNQNWYLEIRDEYVGGFCDSLLIESSSGIAKVKPTFLFGGEYTVLTVDSLETPLLINKDNDFICVYTYLFDGYFETFSIAFGDYEGSYIHNLQQGYSIARIIFYSDFSCFYKCSTPTLGDENSHEFGEMQGFITGNIYDDNVLLTSGSFNLDEVNIYIDEQGFFGSPYSRTYSTLWYNNTQYEIDPISIEPQETLNCDIYFTSTSINKIKKDKNITFSIFPNPATDIVQFFYKTDLYDEELRIEIHDINGKLVDKVDFQNIKVNFITYPTDNLRSGLYVCSLISENNKLRDLKLIIQK